MLTGYMGLGVEKLDTTKSNSPVSVQAGSFLLTDQRLMVSSRMMLARNSRSIALADIQFIDVGTQSAWTEHRLTIRTTAGPVLFTVPRKKKATNFIVDAIQTATDAARETRKIVHSDAPVTATGAPSPAAPAQWGPDPYVRHTHRLFANGAWTDHVADNGIQSNNAPGYQWPRDPEEGWAPDPFGRFSQRYYRLTGWTQHVSNGDTTNSDVADHPPPSSDTAPPPPPPVPPAS